MPDPRLLLTCEHAVNHVPDDFTPLYEAHLDALNSHRGWDPGALELAQTLAVKFSAPCIAAQVSRLLVDHNRSPHNRSLWSEISRALSEQERAAILQQYYKPFRQQTGDWISARIDAGDRIVHLSVHSFTPVFDGQVRDVDIGLLYDPGRSDEAFFADLWKAELARLAPELRVRFNVPYRGRSDCHQSTYRNQYPCLSYLGIELEINQALLTDERAWQKVKAAVGLSLTAALSESGSDE